MDTSKSVRSHRTVPQSGEQVTDADSSLFSAQNIGSSVKFHHDLHALCSASRAGIVVKSRNGILTTGQMKCFISQ
jgi:hypothetical protein